MHSICVSSSDVIYYGQSWDPREPFAPRIAVFVVISLLLPGIWTTRLEPEPLYFKAQRRLLSDPAKSQKKMAPLKARGGGSASLMAGAAAIAVAVLASVAVLTKYAPYTSPNDFRTLLWQVDVNSLATERTAAPATASLSAAVSSSPKSVLSKAHNQMLKVAAPHRQSLFEMLGCECQDISKVWLGDNQWGNYAPKCCSRQGSKHSVSSILDEELKLGTADLQKIKGALKQAKASLHQKLSIIVDAVTLKNAGRPGPPGPQGRKGPQGYTGSPGLQGPRGMLFSISSVCA
jgi:hypothetical protein